MEKKPSTETQQNFASGVEEIYNFKSRRKRVNAYRQQEDYQTVDFDQYKSASAKTLKESDEPYAQGWGRSKSGVDEATLGTLIEESIKDSSQYENMIKKDSKNRIQIYVNTQNGLKK